MASSNHDSFSSVTVNRHSIGGTPSLHMEYASPPLQTVLSCQAVPSFSDFNDYFLFPDLGFGDSVAAQAELLPAMKEIGEELWLIQGGGGGGDSISIWLQGGEGGGIGNGDVSSGSGSVPSGSNFSAFSPLPTSSTNTHATENKEPQKDSQEENKVRFIVENDGNSLSDGYSWRKYGEKSIKHRDYRRSYYKCGHYGCMVKKQVERSSEKPAQYFITYYGRHNHHAVTNFSRIGYN